jgi:transglutaminase-like putative cysteine protease/heme exporter protein D
MNSFRARLTLCICLAVAGITVAQDVRKTQVSSWVTKNGIDVKVKSDKSPTGGFYYLLIDRQYNLPKEEKYYHYAYKILSSEGVQQMSDISIDFDPSYQRLTIHSITIYRENKRLDKLESTEIKTVQREESMDRFLYDGRKTAYFNLKDIRSGDIVEYEYTIEGFNPVFKDHFSEYMYVEFSFPYQKLFQRVILPKDKEFKITYGNGEIEPYKVSDEPKEYSWVLENVDALLLDDNSPGWYDPYRHVTITNFKNWGEVNTWASEQFNFSISELSLKRNLPAELFEGDLKSQITKAIRFVQDEVRYLGFENGINSHKPHSPLKVLDQRFGDCKDKSLLLSSIIKLQGAEASPVLVNTVLRDKIKNEPATSGIFDHCIVQVKYNGNEFYVDPTIGNQGGDIESIYFPRYGAGLVLNEATTDLTLIETIGISETIEEQFFEFDKVGESARLHVKTTYSGYEADWMRSELSSKRMEETQKSYLSFYGNLYPDIEVSDTLKIVDNRDHNILIVEENYTIPSFWKTSVDVENQLYCELYPQSIERFLNVNKLTKRKAPYRLSFPLSYKHFITIKLPEEWTVENDDLKIESDYYFFEHSIRYSNNEIKLMNHYRTQKPEVPAELVSKFVADHQKMLSNITFNLTYNKSVQTQFRFVYVYIVLIALVVGALLVIKIYKYDPVAEHVDSTSIGGWLILVAIGLSLTPLRILIELASAENSFFNGATWDSLFAMKQYGFLVWLSAELAYNIIFIFFTAILVVLFFQRRTSVPLLAKIFYGTSLFVVVADSLAASSLAGITISENLQDILQSLFAACIWIPYFHYSERVKETFTTRLS